MPDTLSRGNASSALRLLAFLEPALPFLVHVPVESLCSPSEDQKSAQNDLTADLELPSYLLEGLLFPCRCLPVSLNQWVSKQCLPGDEEFARKAVAELLDNLSLFAPVADPALSEE